MLSGCSSHQRLTQLKNELRKVFSFPIWKKPSNGKMHSQGLIALVQNTLHNSQKLRNITFPGWPHLSELQPPPQDNLSTLASSPTQRESQRDSQAPFDSPHPRSGLLSSFYSWALEVLAKSEPSLSQQAGWHLLGRTVCFFAFWSWLCPDSSWPQRFDSNSRL